MEIPSKIVKKLSENNVRFLVIGGIAAVAYGVTRSTYDIDILIPPDPEEIPLILKALNEIGYKDIFKIEKDEPEKKVKIGGISQIEPSSLLKMNQFSVHNGFDVDIHIAPTIQYFDFIYKYKVELNFKDIIIPLPSLIDLIHLKESMGRIKDLDDAKHLRYILKKRKGKKILLD